MGNEQFRPYPTMPGFYNSVTSLRNQNGIVVTEYLKLDISSDSSVSLSESPTGNACKDKKVRMITSYLYGNFNIYSQ